MGYIQLAILFFQMVVKLWDAVHEHNLEVKKKKTEALQSGLRGVIDRDSSRITASFDAINDLNNTGRVRQENRPPSNRK